MEPDDTILDAPVSFPGAVQGKSWSPRNYNNEYYGEVPLRKAIALSLNSATVRLASQVGIKKKLWNSLKSVVLLQKSIHIFQLHWELLM